MKECYLVKQVMSYCGVIEKQKQQKIHDLEQIIEELTIQQEAQRREFAELYQQLQCKDQQIQNQQKFIQELSETIEN